VSAHSWARRAGLVVAGALATTAPVLLADQTADEAGGAPARALAAAAAWHDVLEAHAAPQLPPPDDTESAIVILQGAPLAERPPAERAAAAAEIALQHATAEPSLRGIGATINFRYRAAANGFGIRVPTGRLPLVAELPEVKAVYPVTYLAPAQGAEPEPGDAGLPLPATPGPPVTAAPAGTPATIAVIDAGVQAEHPWLGGGIGPDRLIIGGTDFVNGNPGPQASPDGRFAEAHGTEVAALVLRSEALGGLPPERMPRMLVSRVVARELVDGRVRALARSDRVVAAVDRAVDPNGDGDLSDRAEVVLLGVARGYGGGGTDPVAAAAEAADAAGSLVVAPAGNDGPTFGSVGTVAGPAASERVLTVGGLGTDRSPRTAVMELEVGPASARLEGLPLIGPDPPSDRRRVVVLAGPDGILRGDDPRDYADARGRSRVAGAIAVVGRGGDTLQAKARAAAQLGAVALAVWDQEGPGLFPGIRADGEFPIPVVGMGARQGQVLLENPGFTARLTAAPTTDRARSVPSFSSRGPTADGRLEPDVIAPAVDVETAYPGGAGDPQVARMSGTSAAAAQVAALALRLRADRPELSPADVRSLIVQAAQPLPGVPATSQGAGVARMPGAFPVTVEPAVVSGTRTPAAPTELRVRLHDLAGNGAVLRLAVDSSEGVLGPGEPVTLGPGARAQASITIPAGADALRGTLHVVDAAGRTVAIAPVHVAPRPRVAGDVLGVPAVTVDGDVAQARVSIGAIERTGAALVVAPLRDVGLWLVPAGGGAPIRMAGQKQDGDWPAGTYRFMITRRRADGQELAAGRYRLRVSARTADGTALSRESAVFTLP
jgi:hypothetical protein